MWRILDLSSEAAPDESKTTTKDVGKLVVTNEISRVVMQCLTITQRDEGVSKSCRIES
jgi:hypothetical protein